MALPQSDLAAPVEPAAEPPLTIVFSVDTNFLPQASVVITSILRNLSPGPPITFHVLFDGEPSERSRRFARRRIGPHRIEMHYLTADSPELVRHGRSTRAAVLRLRAPIILTEVHRALYFDADIVVLGDVRELFASDLGGRAAGGVLDLGVYVMQANIRATRGTKGFDRYLRRLGMDPAGFTYINSGVMLLDFDRLRQFDFSRRAANFVLYAVHLLRWRDQDTTNTLLRGDIALLHPKWNVMQSMHQARPGKVHLSAEHRAVLAEQAKGPAILHFTGDKKPWNDWGDVPTYRTWWQYAALTPGWRWKVLSRAAKGLLRRLSRVTDQ